jgi:hypothetical protein
MDVGYEKFTEDLAEKSGGNRFLGTPTRRWKNCTKIGFNEAR